MGEGGVSCTCVRRNERYPASLKVSAPLFYFRGAIAPLSRECHLSLAVP